MHKEERMKKYLDLEMDIIHLSQEDIVTASIPNEDTNVMDDPYKGNGWWQST